VQFFRRQWPVFLAFAFGLALWLRYYIPTEESQTLETEFARWLRIILCFAALLGLLSVLKFHSAKIKAKQPGWAFSMVTIVSFAVMALSGFWPWPFNLGGSGFATANMQQGSLFKWFFDYGMVPMQATMFAILAFFIASAAFRAFRARSFEATCLLVAGCIMMIGRVPVGEMLSQSLIDSGAQLTVFGTSYALPIDFPKFSDWLFNVPNAAAQRGILLGVILSQIAIAVRIIFGIERTYMGGGD
jgi:hypothetical protein